jgi:hypothetical protein
MTNRYLTELEKILNGDQQTEIDDPEGYPSQARIQAAMQRGRYMRAVAFSLAVRHLVAWVLDMLDRLASLLRLLAASFPGISASNGSKRAGMRRF